MATFKAVVLKHQQRSDKKYPISIRVTNNRKVAYITTGIYAEQSQIHKKTFEIKDSMLILKTNAIIAQYQNKLLELDNNILLSMSPNDIKSYVSSSVGVIDYMDILRQYKDIKNAKGNISRVETLINEMGIYTLPIHQFTSNFIDKFKDKMDSLGLKNSTKQKYLAYLCAIFKHAQKTYNTEFTQKITHNPFYRLENYKIQIPSKRNITPKQIRYVLTKEHHKKNFIICLDAIKLSFCLCGVNLKDLFVMECSCLVNGRIEYNRSKTKDKTANMSFTSVKIQPEIADIIKRRKGKNGKLFDFDQHYTDDRYFDRGVNYVLKIIGREIGLPNLTSYYFRHSWATIARNKCGVSNDDIDLALVHSNRNPMAEVYIDTDYSLIDKANRKVLDLVFGKGATKL